MYHIALQVRRDDDCRMQLAVPADLTRQVITQFHDNEMGGSHAGIDKTYDKVRRRYFWPNMYRDVVVHINKCEICAARKMKKKLAPMQSLPDPKFPFDIIGIDMCGPFPESSSGNKCHYNC